jgi:LacI family transcriptional regulator
LRGIGAYLRHHGGWHPLQLEQRLDEKLPGQLKDWRPDGVLSRIENERTATALATLDVPIVDLRGAFHPSGGAIFDTDPAACARMTLDQFRQRGLRNLAFCGYPNVNFSEARRQAFDEAAQALGLQPPAVYQPRRKPRVHQTLAWEVTGEFDQQHLADWLTSLTKPVGVFACNDVRGRQVLAAALAAGLAVPDELAVSGVDNDEVICDLATPPLSSIEPDTFRVGYEGAEMLDRLIAGERPPAAPRFMEPLRPVVRRSSDIVAVDDPEIAKAMRCIRDHATEGLNVDQLLEHLTISRATLERRFHNLLGRSPRQEIENIRIRRVKALLTETTYPLDAIAAMTGYVNPNHLITRFKACTGLTPSDYRRPYQAER